MFNLFRKPVTENLSFESIRRNCRFLCMQCGEHWCPKLSSNRELEDKKEYK